MKVSKLVIIATMLIVAHVADAQSVVLRIRPPMRDTLRMELVQEFEMATESGGAITSSMSGSMSVWTRAVVLDRHGATTDMASVTDSVRIFPPSAAALRPLSEAKRALEGRTVRLLVAEDGGIRIVGARGTAMSTEMPSVLPPGAVRVGGTWTRDMRVPLSTTRETTALVRANFRLDSLSRDGARAYLSFYGDVSHNHADDPGSVKGSTTGTLTGSMEIDRRISWITDSQMTVDLSSDLVPPGRAPTHARVRVTQSLTAVPGR